MADQAEELAPPIELTGVWSCMLTEHVGTITFRYCLILKAAIFIIQVGVMIIYLSCQCWCLIWNHSLSFNSNVYF